MRSLQLGKRRCSVFRCPWSSHNPNSLSSDVVNKVLDSNLFPTPLGTNSLENLFNLTSRIGTDGQFRSVSTSEREKNSHETQTCSRCINQATLIAAAKHDVFASVWAYQFDRSYGGYEPVPETCNPPSTPAFPHGDPSLPYYRFVMSEPIKAFIAR